MTASKVDNIKQALSVLFKPGEVIELRALEVTTPDYRQPHTVSGYFDDLSKLAEAAAKLDGCAKGIYITVNPVNAALLARAYNRVRRVTREPLTQDTDIIKLNWFLVDCDPVRPSGISASDEEHELAIERVWQIRAALIKEGWPEPIIADSGNGGHLLFPIDLEPEAANVLKNCLEALAFKFDDERVTIDRVVFNPARIWKLYGTTARKGDDVPERPHRISRILYLPDNPECQ